VSSFIVGNDHIDYLVTAAYAYAADAPGVRERDPQALGMLLYRENIATTLGIRPWDPDDEDSDPFDDLTEEIDWAANLPGTFGDEEPDPEHLAEVLAERTAARHALESYEYRPVVPIDPAQAVAVGACWQYQRVRNGPDHEPESWQIAQTIVDRAAAAVGPDGFIDPAGERSFDNLAGRESLAWGWSRPRP